MDLSSLKDQVSNLTLYDIKAGVRKVQNAVMNYTEMESKVREATNNEPWGASSSLMQEIANGTHSYRLLNEIMPLIYKRFTDKTAEEWRQIYKSLQLLEFLVKNGSERVVDDARQHLSLLRMLRQFHYIDQNGKDQGVNVRNRAQELAKLLSDVESIRAERKKARANRSKYGGVEGGMGIGGGMSGGSRYGGFGSEDVGYGGYRGEVYGDGGGFGGNSTGFQDTQRRGDKFEEYNEDEEDGGSTAGKSQAVSRARASSGLRAASLNTIKRDAKIQKEPEQDLFDFGDEPGAASSSNGKAVTASPRAVDEFAALESDMPGEDDFDDFQSATTPGLTTEAQRTAFSSIPSPPPATSATSPLSPFQAAQPAAARQPSTINDLFANMPPSASRNNQAPSLSNAPSVSSTSTFQATKPPTNYVSPGPNYYTSVQSTMNNPTTNPSVKSALSSTISSSQSFPGVGPRQPSATASSLGKPSSASNTAGGAAGGDVFGSLWSSASGKAKSGVTGGDKKGPDLATMAKAQNEAAMWGTHHNSGGNGAATSIPARPVVPTPNTASLQGQHNSRQQQGLGSGLDDLLS